MIKIIKILILLCGLTIISCENNRQNKINTNIYDPCIDGHDSIISKNFTIDTTTSDFYKLLDLLKAKTEFKKFDLIGRYRNLTVEKDTNISLQKIVCLDKGYDTPIETTILKNVFSISCWLKSINSISGSKNYFPNFGLCQLNFKSESEKDSALNLIRKIGWGDPLKKWNDYTFVNSKKRIYILMTGDATFQDYDNKYANYIQKEWINKNSN